jgi:hypothetical protein
MLREHQIQGMPINQIDPKALAASLARCLPGPLCKMVGGGYNYSSTRIVENHGSQEVPNRLN